MMTSSGSENEEAMKITKVTGTVKKLLMGHLKFMLVNKTLRVSLSMPTAAKAVFVGHNTALSFYVAGDKRAPAIIIIERIIKKQIDVLKIKIRPTQLLLGHPPTKMVIFQKNG
uniref:Uncharacterized protein n=1 Tax=Romanomermis culicivorax TaxID=13658 RepID=A0A915JKH8_ROMCU